MMPVGETCYSVGMPPTAIEFRSYVATTRGTLTPSMSAHRTRLANLMSRLNSQTGKGQCRGTASAY